MLAPLSKYLRSENSICVRRGSRTTNSLPSPRPALNASTLPPLDSTSARTCAKLQRQIAAEIARVQDMN